MPDSDQKPFQEGKLAASSGDPSSSNPYALDTVEYDEWRAGFDYVEETDEDGELREDV